MQSMPTVMCNFVDERRGSAHYYDNLRGVSLLISSQDWQALGKPEHLLVSIRSAITGEET